MFQLKSAKLALLSLVLASTCSFAYTDLSAYSSRTNPFRNGLQYVSLPTGYLLTSGTDNYILQHQVGSAYLDQQTQWTLPGFPTRTWPDNNISYQVLVGNGVGLGETGYTTPQCVALVKILTDTVGSITSSWHRGTQVTTITDVSQLTDKAIAIFNGYNSSTGVWSYDGNGVSGLPNHTAVVLTAELGTNGKVSKVWVVDQNFSTPQDGKIRKHTILLTSGSGVGNLGNYYIIQK